MEGVSTRRVDDLVKAMGIDGISKSEVSRLAAELDSKVRDFRERPLMQVRTAISGSTPHPACREGAGW